MDETSTPQRNSLERVKILEDIYRLACEATRDPRRYPKAGEQLKERLLDMDNFDTR